MWSIMRVSEAAWHEKKHHHRVCVLSHDRHGSWMILKHPSFCLFVTPASDFICTLVWICAAAPTFPALSCPGRWVTLRPQAVTQVWVTANDLPLSHMTLHFLYSYTPRKKKKKGQEYVPIRVPDETHYWKSGDENYDISQCYSCVETSFLNSCALSFLTCYANRKKAETEIHRHHVTGDLYTESTLTQSKHQRTQTRWIVLNHLWSDHRLYKSLNK